MKLYDVAKGEWRSLDAANLIWKNGYITWSHDSSAIYFATNSGGHGGYFRLRIKDFKLEQLFDLKELRTYADVFGPVGDFGAVWIRATDRCLSEISARKKFMRSIWIFPRPFRLHFSMGKEVTQYLDVV